MKLKKIVPYKLRKLIPIMGMAGASVMFGGCEKETITIPYHDVNLYFARADISVFENNTIIDTASYPDVRYVYLIPQETWSNLSVSGIGVLINKYLKPAVELSPKVKGMGDFNFKPGRVSQVPEDSLWLIQNGWTINKFHSK